MNTNWSAFMTLSPIDNIRLWLWFGFTFVLVIIQTAFLSPLVGEIKAITIALTPLIVLVSVILCLYVQNTWLKDEIRQLKENNPRTEQYNLASETSFMSLNRPAFMTLFNNDIVTLLLWLCSLFALGITQTVLLSPFMGVIPALALFFFPYIGVVPVILNLLVQNVRLKDEIRQLKEDNLRSNQYILTGEEETSSPLLSSIL